MYKRSVISSLLFAALAACSSTTVNGPANFDKVASLNGAKVDVQASGGFAGLSTHYAISHDDRAYLFTNRRLCDKNCGAAFDSTSGTLTSAAADSLFNTVLAQDPFSLKDDYGPTQGGADMFDYTVRITADGRTKSVKFDDGTMPEAMRRILEAVRGTVSAARK